MSRYGWSSSLGQISPQTVLSTMSGDGDERPYLEVTHLPGDGFVPVDMTEFRGHTKPDLTTRHTSVADMRDLGLLGKKEDTPSLSGLRQHTPSSPSLRPRVFPQVIGKKRPLQSTPEASKQPNKRVVIKDLGLSRSKTSLRGSGQVSSEVDAHSSNTLGILKEPSLAKEAGQGLIQAISAYSRKDLGGNFTWRPTSEQVQDADGRLECTINGCDKNHHILSHEIKFTCDYPNCNKTFARFDLLHRHQRSHGPKQTGSTDPAKSSPRYTSNGYYSTNPNLPHNIAPNAQARQVLSNKPQPAASLSIPQVPQVSVGYVKPTKEQILSQPLPDDTILFETPPPLAQEHPQGPRDKAGKGSLQLGEVHTEAYTSVNLIEDWLQDRSTAPSPRHFSIPKRDENGPITMKDLFQMNGKVYKLPRRPDGTFEYVGPGPSPTPSPPYQPTAAPRRASNAWDHAGSTSQQFLTHDKEKTAPISYTPGNTVLAEYLKDGVKVPDDLFEDRPDNPRVTMSRTSTAQGDARGIVLSSRRYAQGSPQVNDQGSGRVLDGLAHTISEDMSDKRKLEKYRLCALRSTFNGLSAGKPKKR
ncbi:hypothetical protein LIA77_11040 [Sarocladium implicatum]|nr:hypothetical protein LIA77_11040 [Sarocladium implicatum]